MSCCDEILQCLRENNIQIVDNVTYAELGPIIVDQNGLNFINPQGVPIYFDDALAWGTAGSVDSVIEMSKDPFLQVAGSFFTNAAPAFYGQNRNTIYTDIFGNPNPLPELIEIPPSLEERIIEAEQRLETLGVPTLSWQVPWEQRLGIYTLAQLFLDGFNPEQIEENLKIFYILGEMGPEGQRLALMLAESPFLYPELLGSELDMGEENSINDIIAEDVTLIEDFAASPIATDLIVEMLRSPGITEVIAQQVFTISSDGEDNSLFNQAVHAAVETALAAPTDESGLEAANPLQAMQWDIDQLKKRIVDINILNPLVGENAAKLQKLTVKIQGELEMLNVRITVLEKGGLDTYRPLDSGNLPPEVEPGKVG